jgi:hypothetical protein
MHRLTMLIVAALYATSGVAQSLREPVAPPAELHPPANLDADTLRSKFIPSQLGLKPQTGSKLGGVELPFGMDYSNEAKSVLMPLDNKREWGVGVGLNLNAPSVVELSPNSVLGLQPKRAPGVMLNKRF